MNRNLIVRPDAKADVREIRDYLLQHNERVVAKFEMRLKRLFAQIESMPFLFGKLWKRVRAVKIRGFRYVLYYVVFVSSIEVIAVIHGSRESSAWKTRL